MKSDQLVSFPLRPGFTKRDCNTSLIQVFLGFHSRTLERDGSRLYLKRGSDWPTNPVNDRKTRPWSTGLIKETIRKQVCLAQRTVTLWVMAPSLSASFCVNLANSSSVNHKFYTKLRQKTRVITKRRQEGRQEFCSLREHKSLIKRKYKLTRRL